MKEVQNLNRNKHQELLKSILSRGLAHDTYFSLVVNSQNLNNLFYDIGWRVSKYVDGLQLIVPAANLPGLLPNAARPGLASASGSRKHHWQCCSVASPSPRRKKAKIGPESLSVALSHTFAALSLTRLAALTSQANARNISNYLRALPAAPLLINARGVASYSSGLLPGGSTQQVSYEATQLTPNMQPMSVVCSRSGGRYLSLNDIREQTGSGCANL